MCLSRHFAYSLGTRVLSICYVKTFGNTMLVKSCQGISRNTVSNGLHCKHDVCQRTSRSTLSTRHDPPMRGFTHFAWKRLETPVGQRISRNSIRKPVWIQPAWMKPKKDIINKEARRTEPAMEKYFWEVQSFRMLWSKMVLAGTSRGSTDVMGRINTEPYVGGCGISSKRRRWQGCDRLKKRRNLSMRFRLLFQTLRVPMRQIQPQPSTWRNSIRQTMAMKMIKSKIMRWRCTSCGLQKIVVRNTSLFNKLKILLIEHDKHDPDPENLSVSSKWFHVCVRTGKPSTHVATVSEDDEVWAEDIKQMTATVQESIAEIKANNVPIDFSN